MSPKVSHEAQKEEVSKMDAMEKDIFDLVAIEKMMGEELSVQYEEEIDEIEDNLYEEMEIVDEDMVGELEETTMVKMEVDKEDPKEDDKKLNKTKK
ncbi:unnamed protein product [Lactuca saligna]|uniref:Uncharacterized protein n=1 Tax=Lactuca saligna TaxID=75948 RepID=A0AA35ZFA0_LACSI|nr:unnamed protein product [Lactuca saligna]